MKLRTIFRKQIIFCNLVGHNCLSYIRVRSILSFFVVSALRYTIRFYRVAAYFVINLIMPSLMINVLCMLNFAIPCSSGEKVGYGITVFLAQSVNLMVVMEMMPQGGMSILGIFLAVSILLIGLSLLMNVITLRIYSPSHTKERPWPRLRSLCNKLKVLVGPNDPLPDIVLARRQMSFVRNSLKESDFEGANLSEDEDDLNDMIQKSASITNDYKLPKVSTTTTIPNGRTNSFRFSETYPDSTANYERAASMGNGNNINNNLLNTYDQIPVSFSTQNSLNHILSPMRTAGKKVSNGVKRKRKQSMASPNFRLLNRQFTGSGDIREVLATQELDDDNDDDEERDYTLEWQQHAEIINRFNALIFSLLLILNGILYAVFHSPEASLVSE
ncbi:uncharacterized protein LOC142354315 [Convolutriloba macropyga]|uniref:uncharacterized protein LOC142354315 n=1 Tax=Convolutriloba macropyga TaxID=536237 RepID=UPI003F52868E